MIRFVLLCSLVAAVGCGGDDTERTQPDAAPTPDTPASAPCSGATFDPCATNDQCMSMNCRLFNQSGFSVCTQVCTPGDNSTCPVDATGVNGQCNMMGYCKPVRPNDCTR